MDLPSTDILFNLKKEVAMERVRRVTVVPMVSLLLIITFGILIGVTAVSAQETEAIAPDQSYDIVTILQGQRASVTVTQSTPYSFHSVFVTSIGNSSLSASLSPRAGAGMGWWTVIVIGARSRTFIDYSFGLVPWSGTSAVVDIPSPGFGLVLATQFYSMLPEGGGSYTIAIGQ